jgi:FtsP/CotA-like multicopper oxidase with cupredoxin domain
VIANDGNLLPAAVGTQSFKQGIAERFDVIVDFSRYAGQSLFMVNRAEQVGGRAPTGKLLNPGVQVLKFNVARSLRTGLVDKQRQHHPRNAAAPDARSGRFVDRQAAILEVRARRR